MKDLSLADGIGSDVNYLNGNIVDGQTVIGEHINQDLIQLWQKLVDDASIVPNGNFDNETNSYQLKDALEFAVRVFQAANTANINEVYDLNPTPIALDGTKTITYTTGLGAVIQITGDVTNYTLEHIAASPGYYAGEKLYLYIGGSQNITIKHGTGGQDITTPKGVDVIATPGTLIELVADQVFPINWNILASSKPLQAQAIYLETKVIEIGDWDMDANQSPAGAIPHGLADFNKIRNISAIIRDDGNSQTFHIWHCDLSGVTAGSVKASSTNIILDRISGGSFDSTSFDSTSYNRGWITITYEV